MGKKITFNEINNFIKQNGCILITKENEYQNTKTKLNIQCRCGNHFEASYEKFKHRNKRYCNKCSAKQKGENRAFTYNDVKKYIEENSQCKLLSNKYINKRTKIKLKCKCGNDFWTTFDSFKYKNKRQCNKCGTSRMGKAHTYNEFKDYVEKNSQCILLSKSYINDRTPLKFKCKCGNVFWTQPRSFKFQNKRHCDECGKKNPYNKKDTYKFKQEVYELVGNEYIVLGHYVGANEKIKIQHNCDKCNNNVWEITPSWFLRGVRCPRCSFINHSGKNHPKYNPNLTDIERIKNRDISINIQWRNDVYKRDDYTCQCCGKKGVYLVAHHLDGYNWCKDGRFDINNGITLCENCHKEFHHIYGYGNNTKQQYKKFIKNIKNKSA